MPSKALITGAHGSAWMYSPETAGWEACIRLYFVHLDAYHPILKWFVVACAHLRDEPGLSPASRETPDKTHEFIVAPVDPENYLFEDFNPDEPKVFAIYPPYVLNYQHGKLSDVSACSITDKLVTQMTDGEQIPDEDTRKHWIDSIIDHTRWLNVDKDSKSSI
jgi:hypothetical protein